VEHNFFKINFNCCLGAKAHATISPKQARVGNKSNPHIILNNFKILKFLVDFILVYVERFYSFYLDEWYESYEAFCFASNLSEFLKKQCIGFGFELNFNNFSKKRIAHGSISAF